MTRVRRAARWVAFVLVALVALVVTAAAIVHATWNHERAARSISRWASKTLSGHGGATDEALVIDRVEYPLWPALRSVFGGRPVRVDVHGFHVYDRDGEEALGSRHVNVGLRLGRLVWHELWALLPGPRDDLELYFVDAVVDELHADIHHDHAGDINLFAAFKRRIGTESTRDKTGGMIIDVDRSVIRDSRFELTLGSLHATLEHLNVEQKSLRYSSFPEEQLYEAPAFTYFVDWLAAPRGEVTIGKLRFLLDHFTASHLRAEEPERTALRFSSVTRCEGATIKSEGALLEIYGKDPGIDLHVAASHGARVLETLPSKKWVTGDVSASAHLTGKMREMRIAGDAHHVEAHVEHVDLHDGSGDFVLAHHELAATKLHALVAGGSLDADAKVALGNGDFRAEVRPHDLDLAKLRFGGAVELAAALTAVTATPDSSGELLNELHIHGLDIRLYRKERTKLPDRVVVEKEKAAEKATAR